MLLSSHISRWNDVWTYGHIDIEGDDELQRQINAGFLLYIKFFTTVTGVAFTSSSFSFPWMSDLSLSLFFLWMLYHLSFSFFRCDIITLNLT